MTYVYLYTVYVFTEAIEPSACSADLARRGDRLEPRLGLWARWSRLRPALTPCWAGVAPLELGRASAEALAQKLADVMQLDQQIVSRWIWPRKKIDNPENTVKHIVFGHVESMLFLFR